LATITADEIVDRVRSLCVSAPFDYTEAPAWDSFNEVPTTAIDGVFRIPPPSSQKNIGRFGFIEDRTDSMQIWVARKYSGDFDAARRAMLKDVHSLTSAVVRDAYQGSGEYTVPDEGRGHAIATVPKGEYVTLRLTLPLNYEIQL
jgi:hypothetical protein